MQRSARAKRALHDNRPAQRLDPVFQADEKEEGKQNERRSNRQIRRTWIMKVRNADQESKRRRNRGNEAPMIIWPRDVAKLLRQLLTTVRGTKK